jgi:hypothetical protein
LTQQLLQDFAASLVATGGPLDPAATWAGVATAIANMGLNTVMSNITEATGAMATRKSITAWNGPFISNTGSVYYEGPLMIWKPASSAEAQSLVAWFLADALTAGNLLYFQTIAPPITLPDELHQASLVLRMNVPSVGVYDLSVVFNG